MRKLARMLAAILAAVTTLSSTPVMNTSAASNNLETVWLTEDFERIALGDRIILKKDADPNIIWKSSDPSVVYVKNGVIKATGIGVAVVSSTIGGKVYKRKFSVRTPKLNKTMLTLESGKTFDLDVTFTKSNVQWSTSNKKVAVVDRNGLVTARSAGKAVIAAKVNGKIYKTNVTVRKNKNEKKAAKKTVIWLTEDYERIALGDRITLKKNPDKNIVWASSNPSAVYVKNGVIKAKGIGTAVISSTIGNKVYKRKYSVRTPKLSKTSFSLDAGKSYDLAVSFTRSTVKWATSDKKVATVNKKGHVTAKSVLSTVS